MKPAASVAPAGAGGSRFVPVVEGLPRTVTLFECASFCFRAKAYKQNAKKVHGAECDVCVGG